MSTADQSSIRVDGSLSNFERGLSEICTELSERSEEVRQQYQDAVVDIDQGWNDLQNRTDELDDPTAEEFEEMQEEIADEVASLSRELRELEHEIRWDIEQDAQVVLPTATPHHGRAPSLHASCGRRWEWRRRNRVRLLDQVRRRNPGTSVPASSAAKATRLILSFEEVSR